MEETIANMAGNKYGPDIPPYTVNINIEDAPQKGNKDAPINVVGFADYECPYYAQSEGRLLEILPSYGDNILNPFISFPLPIHPNAVNAAFSKFLMGK